jgi:purine-binding chemotaxis protein CheW
MTALSDNSTTAKNLQVLTWRNAGQLYGLELGACRDVEENVSVQTVPRARPFVAGIANVRGDVVTILDLRALLGYARQPRDTTPIVRLKSQDRNIAIQVDALSDILEVNHAELEPPPANLGENESAYLRGVSPTPAGLLIVLNARSIIESGIRQSGI